MAPEVTKYFDLKDHPNVNYEGLNKRCTEILKNGIRPLTIKRVKAVDKRILYDFLSKNKVAVAPRQKHRKLAHMSIALIRAVEGLHTKNDQPLKVRKAKKVPVAPKNSYKVCLTPEQREEFVKIQAELKTVSVEPRKDTPQCIVCLIDEMQFAFDNCGHAGICKICSEALNGAGKKQCPVCRKPYNKYVKLHLI